MQKKQVIKHEFLTQEVNKHLVYISMKKRLKNIYLSYINMKE